jgi:acyl-CoA synthetase (AMP-forming)/AMP-acid ligase II
MNRHGYYTKTKYAGALPHSSTPKATLQQQQQHQQQEEQQQQEEEEEEEEQEEEEDWVTINGVKYFRTGDIGELVAPGQVRIIDRCKSFFKLAQGVFIAPEPIEVSRIQYTLRCIRL